MRSLSGTDANLSVANRPLSKGKTLFESLDIGNMHESGLSIVGLRSCDDLKLLRITRGDPVSVSE
jgi:hypothetical protein